MSTIRSNGDPLLSAYLEQDTNKRSQRLRIALLIATPSFLAGVLLDYFVYPEHLRDILLLRLLVAGCFTVIYAINQTFPNRRTQVLVLGITTALVANLTFIFMVWMTEGGISPYYAGINLIILGLSVIFPWNVWETLAVCVASLLGYVLACFAHGNLFEPEVFSIFFNNTFFILITSVICVVSSHVQSQARFEDFRLRHQLDLQNQELQAVDRMKTNFFSNVTHELRTPLTLILGPIETALKKPEQLDPRVHDQILIAQKNCLRLLKLINDLLDLTRMEGVEGGLNKQPVQLDSFLGGLTDSIRHLALAKGLTLRHEPPAHPLSVPADPARLEKVVLNLLTNAVKFTPSGGNITVSSRTEGDFVVVEVKDTGKGIAPEELPRIFERFYQTKGGSDNQSQGVGIGLSLAKEITERHGGHLEAQSVPGQGTTFSVHLPATDSGEPQAGAERVKTPALEESPEVAVEPFLDAFRSADRVLVNRSASDGPVKVIGSGDRKILVIDDEPDMLQYVSQSLAENHRVIQATHGRNAESLVREHQPELAVVDWMLPERDGLSICQGLRSHEEFQDLKIIMLTARVDEESKIKALRSGADDFLTKPFSSVELLTRVDNLIANRTLQVTLRERKEELERTLRQLQETESKLIQSEKMNALGSLSAGLLHEVNNPLNYAYSAVQLLTMDLESFDSDTQETIGDIKEGMERVRDVITDLKTFAYPEKPGQISSFTVVEAFRLALKIASRDVEVAEIKVDLPEDLQLRGQKTQITHVFINLLSNAGKALIQSEDDDRPKVIRVTGKEDSESITVVFSDTGCGMGAEVKSRVFEPFFTTRDVGSGMGMGLSICHTIIENHGGKIRVESTENEGSTFTIEFPKSQFIDQ